MHHKLPTKYFDFICVANHLTTSMITAPLNAGEILSKCNESKNIQSCYDANKDIFDKLEIDFHQAVEISTLLQNNIWFKYFVETLDVDLGWIDFEKEIASVIESLDISISNKNELVSTKYFLSSFILKHFGFFIDFDEESSIYQGGEYYIQDEYLREYIHNSKIFVADKKKIFEELYSQLLKFSKALNIYLECFVEKALDLMRSNDCFNKYQIELIKQADNCISFNYTSTLEKIYFSKNVYHVHGTIKNKNIVLGVNANANDDVGTNNTSLLKFKKYYQREILGTDREYIDWYRETMPLKQEYRVVVIGHSLDETDKDILSDVLMNAKEIFITYYDDNCRDAYIENIVKIFGQTGFSGFKKDKNMKLIPLSDINDLKDVITSDEIEWIAQWDSGGKMVIV